MQKYYKGQKENHKQKAKKKHSWELKHQAVTNYGILHEIKRN